MSTSSVGYDKLIPSQFIAQKKKNLKCQNREFQKSKKGDERCYPHRTGKSLFQPADRQSRGILMKPINHRCPNEDGWGTAVCCLFQHKTKPPKERNPKGTSKWQIEKKLKRAGQLLCRMETLPGLLFTRTAVCLGKPLSHKLLEARRVFLENSICCLVPPPTVGHCQRENSGITVSLLWHNVPIFIWLSPDPTSRVLWLRVEHKEVGFFTGDNTLE